MFEVIEKATGKSLTVYAVQGDKFLVNTQGGFSFRDVDDFCPVQQGCEKPVEPVPCKFTTSHESYTELDKLLDGIKDGSIPVELGDTITIKLTDGKNVDLVVTDKRGGRVRLESRDCLGIRTSARELDDYLSKVYALLPDALKQRIVEVEREHLDSDGERYTTEGKLFVPAASEIFPPDECYGDDGLYEQLEWYKDVHNRVRAECRGGDSHWYWTSSPTSGNSNHFCFVSSGGNASNDYASDPYGLAPFGCII